MEKEAGYREPTLTGIDGCRWRLVLESRGGLAVPGSWCPDHDGNSFFLGELVLRYDSENFS